MTIPVPRSAGGNRHRKDLEIGNHADRYIDIAAAYALEGKIEEAKSAITKARHENPYLTIRSLPWAAPNIPGWYEGLREAGLPDD